MPDIAGLHVELRGPLDGPPVILSSGLGGSAHYWEPNIEALSWRHRVILYDHRGTGRSGAIDPDEPVTVTAWAKDMLALMDALDLPRASIIGHAAGGLAGLVLALKHPERVDRLVVVNGWARPDPHTQRCFETRLSLLRDSGVRAYLHAQPLFLFPASYISEHAEALVAAEDHQVAGFPAVTLMEARIAALRAFDIHMALGRIDRPVMLLSSADDMLVPARCSAELAAGLPQATLVELPWGGHAVNVTDPEGFAARILPFLPPAQEP